MDTVPQYLDTVPPCSDTVPLKHPHQCDTSVSLRLTGCLRSLHSDRNNKTIDTLGKNEDFSTLFTYYLQRAAFTCSVMNSHSASLTNGRGPARCILTHAVHVLYPPLRVGRSLSLCTWYSAWVSSSPHLVCCSARVRLGSVRPGSDSGLSRATSAMARLHGTAAGCTQTRL